MESPAEKHRHFLNRCIQLATEAAVSGGGPFGALVVKDGRVVAEAYNRVTNDCDPTAHAEVTAIRKACKALGSHQLTGAQLYSSCEPCPMCLGAIYWSRLDGVFYAASQAQAAAAGFDDSLIYREAARPAAERQIPFTHMHLPNSDRPFMQWQAFADKTLY